MPLRTGNTYVIPGKGVVNTKRKTYSGSGKVGGTRKVKAPKPSEVPTVTSHQGRVISTSGFSTPRAASQAKRQVRSSQARVSRIEAQRASALGFHHRTQERASQRLPQPSAAALSKRNAPITTKTVVSSKPLGASRRYSAQSSSAAPSYKPPKFQGSKTAGTPSLKELQGAQRRGLLRTNRKGYVTTPAIRKAASGLKSAKRAARRSQPSVKGLSPQERAVVPLVRKAHRKYPDIPASLLMALTRQESGFNPAAVSSAQAQGLTQFIPSTAASYGVKYGTGRKEQQSQETGAARLLHSSGFASDPKGALTSYTGGYSDAEYNNPVLEGAADYKALDRPGSPKAARRLRHARTQARKLGLSQAPKPQGQAAKSGRLPSVVYIGHIAEKKFGLTVGENPAFGGVSPVHTSGSYHYRRDKKGRGEAIDASGSAEQMAAFDQWVAKKYGSGVTELFYDPGISIKEGTKIGAIGGHEDHVHVAIAQPGETFGGTGYTAPSGSAAVFVGYGSTPSAAATSATNAAQAAAKGKGRRTSPVQGIFRKLKRLAELGAGVSQPSTEGTEDRATILKSLEKTYGGKAV